MKPVNDIMKGILGNENLHDEFLIRRIMFYWKDIVGPRISKCSYIDKINNEILYLVVTNAPWMQQIKMQQQQILAKVNKFYGKELVKSIRMRVGIMKPAYEWEGIGNTSDLGEEFPFDEVEVSEKAMEVIEARIADIKNPKLRESLKNLAIGTIKRNHFIKKLKIATCPRCQMYMDQHESICYSCRWKEYRKHIGLIKGVILKKPDMNYKECNEVFPCKKDDYYLAKDEVMQQYRDMNNCKEPALETMYIFTMLATGKERNKLTEDYVRSYSAKYRRYYE